MRRIGPLRGEMKYVRDADQYIDPGYPERQKRQPIVGLSTG
jgi:hypothetical protein